MLGLVGWIYRPTTEC